VSEVAEYDQGIKYVSFSDPDGNSWVFQEMPWRSAECNEQAIKNLDFYGSEITALAQAGTNPRGPSAFCPYLLPVFLGPENWLDVLGEAWRIARCSTAGK
jgi:hypothetical protein